MQVGSRSAKHGAWLELLRTHRAIAVIRSESLEQGMQMAAAVEAAGMPLIEVTWNSDRPAHLIEALREQYPHCHIGAGTILNQFALEEALQAGAQFVFSPHTDPTLIHLAVDHQCPVIPGALSPTEILAAWQAGADSVKIFPAQSMGGAQYIKNLQGPLGQIPLIPTGGITAHNSADYLQAGAIAVGVASCLFLPCLLQKEDWLGLVQHIRQFRAQII